MTMPDGTRCDILTDTHAIEVDFADKWAEAIGQSLNYAMPHWDNGWDFQLIKEYHHDSDLVSGDVVVADGLSEDAHLLHIEGVYTWDKTVRITANTHSAESVTGFQNNSVRLFCNCINLVGFTIYR